MDIYLIKGSTRFQLPVLPTELSISTNNNTQTIDIFNLGEINLKGKQKLTSISFSSLFPSKYYDFCRYKNLKGLNWSTELLDNWCKSGEPIQLVIVNIINMACTIESFEYSMKSGKDIYYTISLKEYRYLSDKNRSYYVPSTNKYSLSHKNSKYTRPSSKPVKKPSYYIVKSSDTLAIISKKIFGTTAKWREIANKNNIKNPNKIKVGQKLVIP